MTFDGITGFRMVAGDARRLAGFYEALGFAIGRPHPIDGDEMAVLGIAGGGWRWPMRLGASRVDLDQFDTAGRPIVIEADIRNDFQHLAIVTADIAGAWDRARAAGARPISRGGPVVLPPASGGVTAVKFRDPEGHPLEFLQFARPEEGAVARIDHSAIVTRDVAASQLFYRGHGLVRGDATCNRGREQALLDRVSEAVVEVVPMLPAAPAPHVELLGYRTPVPGGTCWSIADHVATRFVWRGTSAALLRDPDGHFHQVSAG